MASQRKIGAFIALDGEKDFKSAVTSCNKSLGAMKSEMNLVKAQTAGNANSLETLKKKHEILTRTLEEQVKKEEAVRKGLDHAEEQYSRVGKELSEYKDKLAEARKTLQQMEESGTATEEEMQKQRETVEELANTVEKGEKTYQEAGDRIQDWKKQLNNAEAQTMTATKALDKNAAYMEEAKNSTDGCAVSIDKYGKKINGASKETSQLNKNLTGFERLEVISKNMDKLSDSAKRLAGNAYQAALELDEGYDTIITKTGATGDTLDELNGVADRIFGDMPVAMADVGIAVGEVNTRFGQTGEVLEETSKQFMQFAEVNKIDLNSSIDTTDRILKQFNLTADDAGEFLGLLTKRGQETGISVTDLMNSLDANAATLKELNFDVAESANLLAMFEINGVDASTAVRGLKTAVTNYAKEGKSAREGLEKTIESIKNAETSTEALAIAQEVFGTKGAQVMADGIRDGRINLDGLSESLDQYGTTVADTYNATLDPWDNMTIATNSLKTAGSSLVGEFLKTATPAIEGATKAVQAATKWFSNLSQPTKTAISAVAAVGAGAAVAGPKLVKLGATIKTLKTASETTKALKAMNEAQKITASVSAAATAAEEVNTAEKTKNAAASAASATATTADAVAKGAETVTTGTATIAQEGLNLAMEACPVLLLVAGIGALVGAVALFASGTGEAGDAADELNKKVDDMSDALTESQQQMASAMDAAAEAVDNAQAKAAIASTAARELANLADKTSLTNEEQKKQTELVGKLNSLYPEMGLEIDSVTGKLNMSSEEITNYVENAKNIALIEAYNRAAADSYDQVVEATTELTKAEEIEKDVKDELKRKTNQKTEIQKKEEKRLETLEEAERDYQEALASGADNVSEYAQKIAELENGLYEVDGRTVSYTEAMETLEGEIQDLTAAQEKATEGVTNQKAAVDDLTTSADAMIDKADELNQANEERIESINQMNEAYEQAAQTSITTAGQELDTFNGLSERQQQLAVDVTNSVLTMQENVQSALDSQMNMFEKFDGGVHLSTDALLENMQSQVDGVKNWEQNLAALADRGINEDLLQNLAEMGPKGAGYVQTFTEMSDKEFQRANILWRQSVNIKDMGDQWGQELTQAVGELSAGGTEEWNELAKSMGMESNEAGVYVMQGMVSGMKEAADQLIDAGEEAGDSLLKSIDTSLGVASPSKKTRQSGIYVIAGLSDGIQKSEKNAREAAETVGNRVVDSIKQALSIDVIRIHGYNVSLGLAEGMRSGKSQVIAAATEVAAAGIIAAQNRLDIHSPSKVFYKMGAYSVEGAIQGTRKEIPELKKTYEDTAQAAIDAYETEMKNMIQWANAGQASSYDLISDSAYKTNSTNGNKEIMQVLKQLAEILENCGITQNITINGSQSTATENARALKKVGRELAFGR